LTASSVSRWICFIVWLICFVAVAVRSANFRTSSATTAKPRIYSLRSGDQPVDEGVLPTPEEQKKFKMTIIKLPNTIHNDMDDNANTAQRKEINGYVLHFLSQR
jgi:hypothetical protein